MDLNNKNTWIRKKDRKKKEKKQTNQAVAIRRRGRTIRHCRDTGSERTERRAAVAVTLSLPSPVRPKFLFLSSIYRVSNEKWLSLFFKADVSHVTVSFLTVN